MKACKIVASFKVIMLLMVLHCLGVEKLLAQPSRFSYHTYKNSSGDSLRYRQLFPDTDPTIKYPLVIFLHGSGERGNDNDAQLKWGVMNFATDENMVLHPAFVIAPQCPLQQTWSNYNRAPNPADTRLADKPSLPMELLIGLVKSAMKTLPVDTNRVYITGLSMGGFGTYDAIQRYPNLFAAAVPVCGGGDVSKASTIAHLPIWMFHGANDATVTPLYSLEMLQALTKAGAHPAFTQYPETGHFSWLAAYRDPHMMEWMFRQRK